MTRGGFGACCLVACGLVVQDVSAADRENVIFAYAQVLRADPVYERALVTEQVEQCDESSVRRERDRRSVLRMPARGEEGAAPAQDCQIIEVEREVNRLAGYDVEYRYRGDVFISRVASDPGERIRIRVAVTPASDDGSR